MNLMCAKIVVSLTLVWAVLPSPALAQYDAFSPSGLPSYVQDADPMNGATQRRLPLSRSQNSFGGYSQGNSMQAQQMMQQMQNAYGGGGGGGGGGMQMQQPMQMNQYPQQQMMMQQMPMQGFAQQQQFPTSQFDQAFGQQTQQSMPMNMMQQQSPMGMMQSPMGMMQQQQPARPNFLQMLMGGGAPQQQQAAKPAENPFSPRSLMKTFFEGGSGSGTPGAAGDQQALSTAQSYCQTARDQASQAEGCASRASYGEKGYRMSAADEAQNHANAARAAANSATSAAAGHFSPANDAAAQARNAADRAQAAADRARYNASTGN